MSIRLFRSASVRATTMIDVFAFGAAGVLTSLMLAMTRVLAG